MDVKKGNNLNEKIRIKKYYQRRNIENFTRRYLFNLRYKI